MCSQWVLVPQVFFFVGVHYVLFLCMISKPKDAEVMEINYNPSVPFEFASGCEFEQGRSFFTLGTVSVTKKVVSGP